MARHIPHVFTIPPGLDFAETVVQALQSGQLIGAPPRHDPLWLASVRLFVPTRRAGKAFSEAFARWARPAATLLPDIRPLAEATDDDLAWPARETGEAASRRIIKPMERALALIPVIRAWQERIALRRPDPTARPRLAEALVLAQALGRLIDEMHIEGVPLERLAKVEPDEFDPAQFDEYWSLTREFLALAAESWPKWLEDHSAEDEKFAELAALLREARRLSGAATNDPILIAGSTGSVRATAAFMRAVARQENGAVILPGLDQELDADEAEGNAWSLLAAETSSLATRFAHPQANLKRTLAALGIDRRDVTSLGTLSPMARARNRLISEALRPAETAWRWHESRDGLDRAAALSGLMAVAAADEREEARAVALLMRETLENPAATVALVTADRDLARRVTVELAQLGVEVEDSASQSLGETEAGLLLRLFVEAVAAIGSAPVLALLRHPWVQLGMPPEVLDRALSAYEIGVARRFRFAHGTRHRDRVLRGLAEPLVTWPDGAPLSDAERNELHALAAGLDHLFEPFRDTSESRPLPALLASLAQALAHLVTGLEGEEAPPALQELTLWLEDVSRHGASLMLAPSELATFLRPLLVAESVPKHDEGGARAQILGFLEARLLHVDRLILGGMNEGSFPPAATGDPFLNRPMRLALGLQPPERRIGQGAHDLLMLAGHRDLVLTRAERVGTSPGIPSRFLLRLKAFAGQNLWEQQVEAPGEALLEAMRHVDDPGPSRPVSAPAVVPAPPRLPERIALTDFRTLRRDPYALYARRLLRLEPLDPLDPEPDNRLRGTILHRILENYARSSPPVDLEAAAMRMRDLGANEWRQLAHELEIRQFWSGTLRAITPDFVRLDAESRATGRQIAVEVRGSFSIEWPDLPSLLVRAKADRIEISPDGRWSIVDYKTGTPPKVSRVLAGFEPQLALTAALAKRGAFEGLGVAKGIESLVYFGLHASGLTIHPLRFDPSDPEAASERIWREVLERLHQHGTGARPFASRIAVERVDEKGPYDHLARVAEWAVLGDADDDLDADEVVE
jgi:ATP-dependent helicase/nuclease subunit B